MTEPIGGFDPLLIAACGMNCGICRAHLRERNPCRGCREAAQNRPPTRVHCQLRCCSERRGQFCDCPDVPCARLHRLDERYRARFGTSPLENLASIRDRGMGRFLEDEHRRWVSDGLVLCVHDGRRYPAHGERAAR